MGASIVLTGLAANDPVPGVYEEINFAVGPAAGYGGIRTALFLVNKTTAGNGVANTTVYGPDTPVPLQTEADMINFGGAGSEAHRVFRKFVKFNKNTPAYWVFVPQSAGAAATGVITIANTAAANGYVRAWVGDEFVDTPVNNGDTPQVITQNIANSVNGMTWWGATAAAANTAAPVLTLGATNSSGGTFAAGAEFWVVTALVGGIETAKSNEVTATLVLNGTQVLNWAAVPGATGYKVYRATSTGGETGATQLVTTLTNVLTYTDTGTALTAGSAPTTTTLWSTTLTAKQTGLRGNWIRFMAIVVGPATITTTSTATTDAFMSGGTTADSNTTALATVLAKRYYRILSGADDATQVGALVAQVNSQALPTSGIRQRVFFGSVDTLANTITTATGLNAARAELVWSKGSPFTPAELAAYAMSIYSLLEDSGTRPRNNFSQFPSSASDAALWVLPPSRDPTLFPSRSDLKSALLNGITPIGVTPGGSTFLAKRITTRSLNGTNPDYRTRDAHKVTIPDFYVDDLHAKISLQYGGKDLIDNPPKGQKPPTAPVVWPDLIRGSVNRLTDDYGLSGNCLLQHTEDVTKPGTIVQRETNPTTRVSGRIPLWPVDIADQFTFAVDQVG